MPYLSELFPQFATLSVEDRRRLVMGLILIFMLFLFGVAAWLSVRHTEVSINQNAFDFMEHLFPGAKRRNESLIPVSKDQITNLQNKLKKLTPKDKELRKAQNHLIQALSYLYRELEAESAFGRYAGNHQYEEAERASKELDEARGKYISEYRKAENYMNVYRKRIGSKPVYVKFPDED